jgi:hypothetical protein
MIDDHETRAINQCLRILGITAQIGPDYRVVSTRAAFVTVNPFPVPAITNPGVTITSSCWRIT